MKKALFTCLALTTSLVASAQWTAPTVGNITELTPGDTLYLYNVGAKLFLTQGNNYGTQASVAEEGLKIVVDKYIPTTQDTETEEVIEGEWDGKTYTIQDYRPIQQKWYYMFIDSDDFGFNAYGGCFMDRSSQENYFWEFEGQEDGSYRIHGADLNPKFNLANYPNCYLGVVSVDGNTNTCVFPLIDLNEPLEECQYYMNWIFVSQVEYSEYTEKLTLYNAAQALKASIDELISRGIDVAALRAVYDNASSTLEELTEAQSTANQLIAQDDEKNVTPDNPKDFSGSILNADFSDGVAHWTKTGTAKTFEANGWVPTTVEEVMVAPALNLWGANQYINVEQTVVDIPNGIYKLSCGVYSQANGPFIFANDAKSSVTTGGPAEYSVLTYVQDNSIRIGVGFPAEGTQWVMADCFRMMYFGNGFEAYKMWIDETLATSATYDETTPCTKALYMAYSEKLSALLAATDQEAIVSILPEYLTLADSMKVNVAAYSSYNTLVDEALQMSESESYAGEDFDMLCDYVTLETAPDDVFPNGSAQYILTNGLLTAEEIQAETAYLDSLMKAAVTNGIAPGANATAMLVNPNFDNAFEGWTYNKKLGVPSPGGMETNPNVERWNQNFDFYQTVKLPNGVYRVDAQAFYRTAGNAVADTEYTSGEAEVLTFLYANTNEVAVKNIYEEAQERGFYKEDNAYAMADGVHEVPNSMKTASEAFTAGLYENSVTGVVSNGTLRLGIRSLSASATDRWSIWDNFRITFLGFDAAIIYDCYVKTRAEAEEMLNEELTEELKAALLSALDMEVVESDGRATLAAIGTLRDAIDAASSYVTGVSAPLGGASSVGSEAIYSLNGQKASSLRKGMNIIRLSNGNVRKIFVK